MKGQRIMACQCTLDSSQIDPLHLPVLQLLYPEGIPLLANFPECFPLRDPIRESSDRNPIKTVQGCTQRLCYERANYLYLAPCWLTHQIFNDSIKAKKEILIRDNSQISRPWVDQLSTLGGAYEYSMRTAISY